MPMISTVTKAKAAKSISVLQRDGDDLTHGVECKADESEDQYCRKVVDCKEPFLPHEGQGRLENRRDQRGGG